MSFILNQGCFTGYFSRTCLPELWGSDWRVQLSLGLGGYLTPKARVVAVGEMSSLFPASPGLFPLQAACSCATIGRGWTRWMTAWPFGCCRLSYQGRSLGVSAEEACLWLFTHWLHRCPLVFRLRKESLPWEFVLKSKMRSCIHSFSAPQLCLCASFFACLISEGFRRSVLRF